VQHYKKVQNGNQELTGLFYLDLHQQTTA